MATKGADEVAGSKPKRLSTKGIIEPEIGRIRRRDIQELLGKGDPDYPNSQGKLLAYGGDRQIPYGSHLLIHFDDNDVVDTVDWVSE